MPSLLATVGLAQSTSGSVDARQLADTGSSLWLWGGLVALALLVVVIAGRIVAKRRAKPGKAQRIVSDWEERAVEAERRAEQAEAVVKAGLLPYLARLLRGKLLLGLLSQRSRLLETQHVTTERVTDLEQRLAAAQSKLQTRIQTYEQRIVELETKTQTKDHPPALPPKRRPPASAKPVVRKNPLLTKPKPADPPPVQFAAIMARRKSKD